MKNLEKLSFKNVEVEHSFIPHMHNNVTIKVYSDDREVLAKAECEIINTKKFLPDFIYRNTLEPEIDSLFYDLLNEEERKLADSMLIDEYVDYMNNKFKDGETELLNEFYNKCVKLNKFIEKDSSFLYADSVYLNTINSKYEKTGAESLIVEYLKDNCNLILLHSEEEFNEYWKNKAGFKEIFNGNMYWSNNEELNKIL